MSEYRAMQLLRLGGWRTAQLRAPRWPERVVLNAMQSVVRRRLHARGRKRGVLGVYFGQEKVKRARPDG